MTSRRLLILALVAIAAFAALSFAEISAGTPLPMSAKTMVGLHNTARRAKRVRAMKWSSANARSALRWARRCSWNHSSRGGENLSMYTGTSATHAQLFKGWVAEKKNWNWSALTVLLNDPRKAPAMPPNAAPVP